jgi:hypothetical protein
MTPDSALVGIELVVVVVARVAKLAGSIDVEEGARDVEEGARDVVEGARDVVDWVEADSATKRFAIGTITSDKFGLNGTPML